MFYSMFLKFTFKAALARKRKAIAALETPLKRASTNLVIFSLLITILPSGYSYADNINYILTSRNRALVNNLDRISDMTANVNTVGFKAEKDLFAAYNKQTSLKENIAMNNISTTVRDDSQGSMNTTGRNLDVAINGDGFFMVNTPYGQMFTRNGSFLINRDGILVTQDGYPVAGPSGGQVEFTDRDINISIKEDGIVNSDGEERGQIGVFEFANISKLERMGKGLFKSYEVPAPAENYQILQGVLENSNVNSITAMTELVAVSRGIETVKKLSSTHNDVQMEMLRTMSK